MAVTTADEVFAVAVAASTPSNNRVELLFDGETVSSGKLYKILRPASGYIASGNRVLCARVSGTWVVLGMIPA